MHAVALRQIVGGDDRDEVGHAVALDVVGDRKAGVGEQVAEQEIDIGLLDEAARLLQRGVGVARHRPRSMISTARPAISCRSAPSTS